jgi:hypothetical protein
MAGRGRTMSGDAGQASDVARGADARFSVSWMSSRVMREASARYAVLHYKSDPTAEDKKLSEQPEEYIILVQGNDMTPFQTKDEKYHLANSYLQTKKAKEKLAPNRVNYELKPDGKSVNAAYFHFPKKAASGEPFIASDEKGVLFICQLGNTQLKVDFDLKKMVLQNTADL